MKIADYMTMTELLSVPKWGQNNPKHEADIYSLVIVPMQGQIHDSGYMVMECIALDHDSFPMFKLSRWSDELFFDTANAAHVEYIDCLPGSGCIKLRFETPIQYLGGCSTLEFGAVRSDRENP